MNIKQKIAAKYIAPIEEAELACRLLEAAGQIKRPKGVTAQEALASIDAIDRDAWRRAAHAAMNYWRECIDNMNATH